MYSCLGKHIISKSQHLFIFSLLAEAVMPEMNAGLSEASGLKAREIILQKKDNLHAQKGHYCDAFNQVLLRLKAHQVKGI